MTKIDTAIRSFLYILIFWLPYSVAVVEICVIASLVLWIVKRIFFIESVSFLKRFQPQPSFVNFPIFFFIIVCLLSIIGSISFEQSFLNFLTKTMEWFVVFFLVIEVMTMKKHLYVALAILTLTAFATALDSFVQYYWTYKDIFLAREIIPGDRATAGFKTSNALGGYLALIIPLAFSWVVGQRELKRFNIFLSVALLCFVWALIITFSRGAWMSALLGTVAVICAYFMLNKKVNLRRVGGATIIFVLTISVIIFALFQSQSAQAMIERSVTAHWRVQIWKDSLNMVLDKPFFGHGINTFMYYFQSYRHNPNAEPVYAHNCYVQLLVETGALGLGCFLSIFILLFKKGLINIRNFLTKDKDLMILSIGLLAGIFSFLIHSFFDTNFYTLQLSIFFWYMIGMFVAGNNIGIKYK